MKYNRKKFVFTTNSLTPNWWIEKAKHTLKTKKVLIENFFSLSFLQVANYIFPLITLPYLVRILKPEKYGLIAFANAFIGYFMILTDYGFHLSAPREISINRNDTQKLSEIFSSIMIIKLFLFVISFFLMSAIIFLFERFRNDWILYYLTFGMVLGHIMFPTWFFQGVENMKFITMLNLLAKLIFTMSIFIFVKKQMDYFLVPLLNSLGFITAGIISLYIVFKNFKINFIIPTRQQIIHQLKEGWHIFKSVFAVNLYTNFNTIFLGILTDNLAVSYYYAADRIVRYIVQLILFPIAQTIYPRVSFLMKESYDRGLNIIRKILKLGFCFYLIFSLFLFIFAEKVIYLVLGKSFIESAKVLKVISVLPLLIFLNNIFGMQTMLNLGLKKEFAKIFIFAGLVNLFLLFILVPSYKHIGAAVSSVSVELMIPLLMFITLLRKKIRII